jgi:acetolactate synthase-1/2/3 large subunit
MHQASISFVGHVGAGLRTLQARLDKRETWPDEEPRRVRQTLKKGFDQGETWGPTAVVETARAVLARDAIATVDSGAHRILLSQVWESYAPRTLLQSTGFCTMGCALPLALGAKLVAPERQVVCFTGDAGLEMVLGELATARDLGLAIIVVVFVDRSLALIELKQRAMQLPNVGVDFGATDFARVATALGGRAANVASRPQLEDALRAATRSERFSLIACQLEHAAYDDRF